MKCSRMIVGSEERRSGRKGKLPPRGPALKTVQLEISDGESSGYPASIQRAIPRKRIGVK